MRAPGLMIALRPALAASSVLVIIATTGGCSAGGAHASAPSRAAPAAQRLSTRGAKWLAGPGGTFLNAVNRDVSLLSMAEQEGMRSKAQLAGTRLAAAAQAALDGPMPPAEAAVYQGALEDFRSAGTYAAQAGFSKAAPLLSVANVSITRVTAAMNPPAPVNAAAGAPAGP